ncbi:MAG: Uma2 family endonuclease, partial [Acidobacteriota bacterium]|nr:Uma2 family endonuclease [Acidobacteriota bacterium]
VLQLARALADHVEAADLGEILIAPTDVVLDADRPVVLQPDLLFVARERSSIVQDRVYGAPDLVIEVLSPHPRVGRLDRHVQEYARAGVREIWVVTQNARSIDVLACERGRLVVRTTCARSEAIRSQVLPDLDLRVDRLAGW